MPNGGSDCCGTCWFNSQNEGRAGNNMLKKSGAVVCTIRNLEIPVPLWTYCVNHPHHNPGKIDLPIGRIFVTDSYPYTRKVWVEFSDTEEIRLKLLELLDSFSESEVFRFPEEIDLPEEVIIQLAMLDEVRAIQGLLKLTEFNIDNYKEHNKLIIRNISIIIGKSIEALMRLSGKKYLNKVQHLISAGLEKFDQLSYNESEDDFAAIRFHLVRGLRYAGKNDEVQSLLDKGMKDPNMEIRTTAEEITKEK